MRTLPFVDIKGKVSLGTGERRHTHPRSLRCSLDRMKGRIASGSGVVPHHPHQFYSLNKIYLNLLANFVFTLKIISAHHVTFRKYGKK